MPIQYKGIDIINMIEGGTNDTVKDIYGPGGRLFIKGAPSSSRLVYDWTKNNSFGITVGNRDLATYYPARYSDHYSSQDGVQIPIHVTRLKIILIGGGGGGGGGSSNWNNGNQPGFPGGGGSGGAVVIANVPRNGNTYKIDIGAGGAGARRGADYGNGNQRAEDNGPGGASIFNHNGQIVASGGGAGGLAIGAGGGGGAGPSGNFSGGHIDWASLGNYGGHGGGRGGGGGGGGNINQVSSLFPAFSYEYGKGSSGGNSGNGNGLNGQSFTNAGGQGFCRVYFIY